MRDGDRFLIYDVRATCRPLVAGDSIKAALQAEQLAAEVLGQTTTRYLYFMRDGVVAAYAYKSIEN
jgi:hypothetical protein